MEEKHTQQLQQGIGQINSANTEAAFCNFTPKAEQGQLLYFMEGNRRVVCRITFLRSINGVGTSGRVIFLDSPRRPPRMGTDLFLVRSQMDPGVYVPLGTDVWGSQVSFRLNTIFRNVLVAGKTQSGKTHCAIVIAEELVRLKVPNLIVDSEDEFLGLGEKFPGTVVFSRKFPEIRDALRQKKIVIVRLMGMTQQEKANVVNLLLSKLKHEKEKSYNRNPNQYPPILITLDEAEIYAPGFMSRAVSLACRRTLQDLAKRGVKFGLGTIFLSQRPRALDLDVRSQCNSGLFFLLDDASSLNAIHNLGYVTKFDLATIKQLGQGEAFATGQIVPSPVKFKVRDITVPRTKNVDFENLLYAENNSH